MEKKEATKVTGCKQCKKGLSSTQKYLVILSVYILGSSVYGTIHLVNILLSFFK